MKKTIQLGLCTMLLTALAGCTSDPQETQYIASDELQPYQQPDFSQYVTETREWLNKHREFLSSDKQKEIAAVAPYELIPDQPNGQGMLLVHGLGDSPYSYFDIAPYLADLGYRVRVILLPGHGTRAADLALPELEDWQTVVEHHYRLLDQQVDGVWLGGFSTGANLVTSLAYRNPEVKGLVLFSPAFKPRDPMAKFSPYAKWFMDWAGKESETNYTRYNSLHMNGAAVYYETSEVVREDIEQAPFRRPAFVILSEADETIDSQFAAKQFTERFTHQTNKLMWYGESKNQDKRAVNYNMDLPEQKILSASHISVVFAPDNPVYKRDGEVRLCFDQQPEGSPEDCSDVPYEQVWFAAYGDGEEDMVRARMSWNPYFEQSMQYLTEFLATN